MIKKPLAALIRPKQLAEMFGQPHLLAEGAPLYRVIHHSDMHSMILWGPPGTGKTTLAHMIANAQNAQLLQLSAVMAGVKDIREAIAQAKAWLGPTILFVDEVHRFNKAQQDAFLPHVEDGTITFIGATTENPSFELNNALLSRCKVYVLNALTTDDLVKIIERGIAYFCQQERLAEFNIQPEQMLALAEHADGDARRALNSVSLLLDHCLSQDISEVNEDILKQALMSGARRFDKGGDLFYEQISALHKAVRGSNPDGALYWFARMIDGGCCPLYIARRVVRMASEDIGCADPRGLQVALNAWDVYQRLGSPEGELAIAQAITYLACAPKSNAVYVAYQQALEDAKTYGSLDVPKHIRNAPTKLMKNLGYGQDYRYDHDENGFSAGQTYLPHPLENKRYYHPQARGLEIKIKEKLNRLRQTTKPAAATTEDTAS